jgi:hypothetical protein
MKWGQVKFKNKQVIKTTAATTYIAIQQAIYRSEW